MASLEYAFEVFGTPALMDRVERLAFNAMPAGEETIYSLYGSPHPRACEYFIA